MVRDWALQSDLSLTPRSCISKLKDLGQIANFSEPPFPHL